MVGGGDSPSGIIWQREDESHMVCMLPCVARVWRCGQHEWAVREGALCVREGGREGTVCE